MRDDKAGRDGGKARPGPGPVAFEGGALSMLRCRRVEASYTPEEHAGCPYCYGSLADVRTGQYGRFCDFKPGEDPICFGFPHGYGRYAF